MSSISSFKSTETRHDVYEGEDYEKVLPIFNRTHNGDDQF